MGLIFNGRISDSRLVKGQGFSLYASVVVDEEYQDTEGIFGMSGRTLERLIDKGLFCMMLIVKAFSSKAMSNAADDITGGVK